MEIGNLRNFENDGGQLSVPEQLVSGENETSESTELGGEEDPNMHVGGRNCPK